MRPELGRIALALGLAGVAALATTGCSGGESPFRIGVIVDCVGINRPFHDAELSGAELPLIERGAERQGSLPSGGVGATDVSGRSVELIPGCTEVYEFSTLTAEIRRLVEREHVDAVVAGSGAVDEVVMREVAKRYPGVIFIPVVHGPRDVTLRSPPPNLYRFAGDHGQGAAGLATYAYRRLGWRSAAVVLSNWDTGWGERDAFVAEFCALGGRVTSQLALDSFDPAGGDVAEVPVGVDGVAVFAQPLFGPAGFLQRLAGRYARPARRMVVGPSITDDPVLLKETRGSLTGIVGASFADPARIDVYARAYASAFPDASDDVTRGELVSGYRDAVEALLRGLESASGSSAALPRALSGLRLGLLGGPVRLDRNRQAVISTSLVRIGAPGQRPTRVETIPGVGQSVGGLLPQSLVPSDRPARCSPRQRPPPWAS